MARRKMTLQKRKHLKWIGVILIGCLLAGCQPTPAVSTAPSEPSAAGGAVLPSSQAPAGLPSELPSPEPADIPVGPTATITIPPPPSFPITGIELWEVKPGALQTATKAGAFWIRRNSLKWSSVEPEEGQRSWAALAALENEMIAVNQSGSRLILIVSSAPAWAQAIPGSYCGPVAPEKLAAFAQFMHELVLRYSLPPYGVKYWELGNEPDIDTELVAPDSIYGCWGDADDPYYGGGYYADMLKQVYPQIKAADPEAQVMVGGLLLDCDPVNPPDGKNCQSSLFLEGILKRGGGDFFDGISFHGYDYYAGDFSYSNPNWHASWDTTGLALIPKARYIQSLLRANQAAGKFLMNTEVGLLCGRTGDEPVCQTREFDLAKAYYAVEANLAAQAEGLHSNVWYTLYGWRGTQLVGENSSLLPVYTAYTFNARKLSGYAVIRAVNEISGVRGYELGRDTRRMMVLWSVDGQDHAFEAQAQPSGAFNVFGESLPAAAQIMITRQPVYIEWQ